MTKHFGFDFAGFAPPRAFSRHLALQYQLTLGTFKKKRELEINSRARIRNKVTFL